MATNLTELKTAPQLPHTIRPEPNVAPQVSKELAQLSANFQAAIENLTRTPEGEATCNGKHTAICGFGGTNKGGVFNFLKEFAAEFSPKQEAPAPQKSSPAR